MVNFFSNDLKTEDPQVAKILELESKRQNDEIGLIASENLVSKAVLEAQGSNLTNKYAEGYPSRRYYGGCEQVDKVEALAIDRAKQLFDAKFVNVQPHSGSQANATVYLALLKPGDTILGMSLDAGGHLTHGAKPSFSGKWFNSVQYGIDPQSHLIDYEQVHRLALEHKPRMIIAGVSSYSRIIDFKRFREIATEVGAYLMVDMAHFAGLVAAKQYENPIDYADVVTTTTHKTLRGPRGGMILSNNESLFKKLNSALFPGIQGGPLMHVVAAKAVCFKEALQPEFQEYGKNVIKNCQAMAASLQEEGYDIVSGGTDTHLLVLDLRRHQLSGKDAEKSLINAKITCNKNAVPSDPKPPTITSGIRLGSLICTTRGFSEKEFTRTAKLIAKVLNGLKVNGIENNHLVEQEVAKEVGQLLSNFPI